MKFKTARITILGDVLDVVAIVVRAVARFFVTGGHYRECRRHEPCRGGVWGYPPPENCQIWRLRNALFSTCLRKIDLEYENGKQLQVTIIKITESKENKSIQRLDVSGSTGPGGRGAVSPLAPPASYGSGR